LNQFRRKRGKLRGSFLLANTCSSHVSRASGCTVSQTLSHLVTIEATVKRSQSPTISTR